MDEEGSRITDYLKGVFSLEKPKDRRRVLVGWQISNLPILVAGSNATAVTIEHITTISRAQQTVSQRVPIGNPQGVISDADPAIAAYVTQFWTQPDLVPFHQEGWVVKTADLRQVCTIQPIVECVKSRARIGALDPANTLELAKISLPTQNTNELMASFDLTKNAWVFSSPNPNLRIFGQFQQDNLFGFAAGITNSFLQVVKCQGKYFLRDGNHRAFGFLANNIQKVPVLYREYSSISEMGLPQGLFPVETLLGNHPPMLADFLDDSVSTEADFPSSTKVVVIQGLEVNSI